MKLHEQPTTVLKGVGARFAETLLKLDIANIQDLLFHLPYRYVDRTQVRPISSLRMNDVALVHATVVDARIAFGRRRSLIVQVEDGSGRMCLRFFHFNAAQKNSFEAGRSVQLFGEARPGAAGLEFYHPEYDFPDSKTSEANAEDTLTPIYNLTDGVSQPRMRTLVKQAVTLLENQALVELLPDDINRQFGVESLSQAIRLVHFPPPDIDQTMLFDGEHPCQQRLAFEELLAHFLVKQHTRIEAQKEHAPTIPPNPTAVSELLGQLPFSPTAAQQRVFGELQDDMRLSTPMMRMVQGDVGSGKTLVAAMAAASVAKAGYQVAIVAPTEILAEQHYRNFCNWFEPIGVRVDWLVGKLKASDKKATYQRLAAHQSDIVVGTHALFQDKLRIAKLGLVIIDEQHRFGVHQRLSMRGKSLTDDVPHQLVMTATPIPRTLAMTAYAELDFSIIDELPPGRTPVTTAVVSQKRKVSVIQRIAQACEQGRQCYWVCPLIEESETLNIANAEDTFAQLQTQLGSIRSALIHGRQKPAEKEAVMAAFKRGESQVLVATTVIEVGVDVPNASVMIIENPERLGLAQLHQLRGRVGRGSAESHCILLYGDKLSAQGKERLQTLRNTNDGFVIAEKDLEMRGPGEFLGTRQAGALMYRVAHYERDAHMFDQVRAAGIELLQTSPSTSTALVERWFGARKTYALA